MFVLYRGKSFPLYSRQYPHDILIGLEEGSKIELDAGPAWVFRPTMRQYVMNVKRNAQPIYPKDLGLLIYYSDIRSGYKVLEIGLGVGALSIAILNAIGDKGMLITYERRDDFAKQGRRRVEGFLGEKNNFIVRVKDASEGIEDKGFHAAFIDVPEPWNVIENVAEAVLPGANVLAFIPTTIQIKQYCDKVKELNKFSYIEIIETLLRPWDIGPRSLRPAHRMVAHTGFIVICRRLAD